MPNVESRGEVNRSERELRREQRELERVKQIIFEEFADSIALATMSWKKKGRITKKSLLWAFM